jgi:hypothetical protein
MAAVNQPHFEPFAGAPAADAASITPPHSANGKGDAPGGVPSELSDLELDSKAAAAPDATPSEEEIEPDHFYGGGKIPVFKPVSGVVPDNLQDKGQVMEELQSLVNIAPSFVVSGTDRIVVQTMDQFQDFQSFVNRVEKYGMQSGVIKVIPPKEW